MKKRTQITWVGDDFILFAKTGFEVTDQNEILDGRNIDIDEAYIITFNHEVNFDYFTSHDGKLEKNRAIVQPLS